jgi:hypothetical protein
MKLLGWHEVQLPSDLVADDVWIDAYVIHEDHMAVSE